MLRNLATKLVIFHNGNAEFFNGNYDDFLEKIGWESEETKTTKSPKKKLTEKEIKQRRTDIANDRSKLLRPLKEEIERVEAEITKNENLLNRINGELEKAAINQDSTKLADYTHAVGKLNQLIEKLFETLTNTNESVDFINKKYDHELEQLI
jgi:ATP-binding cassette subfamily F protein 3